VRKLVRVALASALLLPATGWMSRPAQAETIWQRAKLERSQKERKTLEAVERVLVGDADELDQFRARTALVALSRGEVRHPLLVIQLARLRRELRLSPARGLSRKLRAALGARAMPAGLRARGELELALLEKSSGNLGPAREALQRSLRHAWKAEVRAELILVLGFLELEHGEAREAKSLFADALRLPLGKRRRVQALLGLGLLAGATGDAHGATRLSRKAAKVQEGRSRISSVPLLWELALSSQCRRAAEALLDFGGGRAEALCEERLGSDARWLRPLAELLAPHCESFAETDSGQPRENSETSDD